MAHNWKRQASLAYGCALTRLALNVYLYFEEWPEWCEKGFSCQKVLDESYMNLLGRYLSGDSEKLLKELDDFRDRVQKEASLVMAYSDGFQIYEYVLNRVERRFKKGRIFPVEESAFVGNLMRYVASAREGAVQYQRIGQIVGQLPVRFTKQKYFSMIHDGLTTYIGSDLAGLNDMVFQLKSGSMAALREGYQEEYKEFNETLSSLSGLSFKDLKEEAYHDAVAQVMSGAEKLTSLFGYWVNMQEMANDLYILCLTGFDAVREIAEEDSGAGILKGLWQQYEKGSRNIPKELTESLPKLEGIQEEYAEKYQRLDFHWEDNTDETGQKGQKVDLLMSGSTFVSLKKSRESKNVTKEDVKKAADDYFASVGAVFSACPKPVARAIMASTLSCLPVFLNSPDDLQAYIQDSLSCCSDPAEKEACMDLLMQLMERDGYELV